MQRGKINWGCIIFILYIIPGWPGFCLFCWLVYVPDFSCEKRVYGIKPIVELLLVEGLDEESVLLCRDAERILDQILLLMGVFGSGLCQVDHSAFTMISFITEEKDVGSSHYHPSFLPYLKKRNFFSLKSVPETKASDLYNNLALLFVRIPFTAKPAVLDIFTGRPQIGCGISKYKKKALRDHRSIIISGSKLRVF
jgi:hypothetical protein